MEASQVVGVMTLLSFQMHPENRYCTCYAAGRLGYESTHAIKVQNITEDQLPQRQFSRDPS